MERHREPSTFQQEQPHSHVYHGSYRYLSPFYHILLHFINRKFWLAQCLPLGAVPIYHFEHGKFIQRTVHFREVLLLVQGVAGRKNNNIQTKIEGRANKWLKKIQKSNYLRVQRWRRRQKEGGHQANRRSRQQKERDD